MPLIASSGGQSRGAAPTKIGGPKAPKGPANSFSTKGLQMGAPTMSIAQTSIGQPPTQPAAPVQPQLDGTALANIAQYLNKSGTTISNDQDAITNYQTSLASAIAQDKQANQMANLRLMTGDNASGGLYGSAYGQQLGNQNTAYGQKEDAATSTANLNIGRLQNAIAELQSSQPIYASGQAADSTARAAALAAKDAPVPVTALSAPKAPAAAKTSSTPAQGVKAAGDALRQAAGSLRPNLQATKTNKPTRMGGFR